MIKLDRERINATVPPSLRGDKRRKREGELLQMWRDYLKGSSAVSPKWKKGYWKTGKSRLKAHTVGKCAYCESPTDVVAHGDVEHFRPKSIYWWLAYCFDNHLFSCRICNETYKLDYFPLDPNGKQISLPKIAASMPDADLAKLVDTFAPDPVEINAGYTQVTFARACQAEKAGLPDPYNDDPEAYFRWEADDVNKEVWVRPRTRSKRNLFIYKSCETCLGLNREELRRWRWKLGYQYLACFKGIMIQANSDEARKLAANQIRTMMSPDQPYSAMVRYFVNDAWKLTI